MSEKIDTIDDEEDNINDLIDCHNDDNDENLLDNETACVQKRSEQLLKKILRKK